ncbi:MAG: arginine deiminase-related protein [Pseudomonadota bacterium]
MGERNQILMCSPDYFTIDYVINPWMTNHAEPLDLGRAKDQWTELRDTIGEYADVVTIDPQPGLPDMVFTANAGAVLGNRAIASHFIPEERRPEEPHFKRWFRDQGFELLALDEKIGFEGAGDCLHDRGGEWVWTGHGFRTEVEAHSEIARFFDREVVPLRLVEDRFYHIDTCFCPLSDGYLMYHPPAFDFDTRTTIEARVPFKKRIVVDTYDARRFACNAVNIGDRVIMNKASKPLKKTLAEHGFELIEVDVTEFLKAGGSTKCLTLNLTEPPVDEHAS